MKHNCVEDKKFFRIHNPWTFKISCTVCKGVWFSEDVSGGKKRAIVVKKFIQKINEKNDCEKYIAKRAIQKLENA